MAENEEEKQIRRVGIFGGTFSPVHNGHIAAAKAFMEQMWLDYLFVIPTGITPHKEDEHVIPALDRFKMCELAFEGMEGVIVSDMEMRRPGKSYTVDTLRTIKEEDPDTRLFLLCGTDMVMTLDKWHEADEIFKLAYPVYARREKDPMMDQMIIQKIALYYKNYGKMVRKITLEPLVISSSAIREKVRKGESISGLVPKSVEDYIREQELYKA